MRYIYRARLHAGESNKKNIYKAPLLVRGLFAALSATLQSKSHHKALGASHRQNLLHSLTVFEYGSLRASLSPCTVLKQIARATIAIALAAVIGINIFGNHNVNAATTTYLNFQARLLTNTGSVVPDGTYNIEFKIYDASSSSGSSQGSCTGDADCLWTETRISTDKVRVVNGYISVNLGSVTAFPSINWDQQHWLTMNIGGTGSPSWDGEMSPRILLTGVPYSFSAGELSKTSGANRGKLSFNTVANNPVIVLPDESGTVCTTGSVCSGYQASGSYFLQNGNSFGSTATLGTNDSNSLSFETNNTTQATISVGGATTFQNSTNSTSAFNINNSSGSTVIGVDTSGAIVKTGTGPSSSSVTETDTEFTDSDNTGQYTSIAIGVDKLPIISSYNVTNGNLEVSHCSTRDCTTLDTATEFSDADNVGTRSSIAIGTDGLPIVSSYNSTNGNIQVSHCANIKCTSLSSDTEISDADNVGNYSSIAIGTDGLPIISSYNSTNGNLQVSHCANTSCTSFDQDTEFSNASDVGQYSSLTIGRDGLPIISSLNGGANNDLQVSKCSNITCTSLSSDTQISSSNDNGFLTSIAIGVDGLPIISHFEGDTNGGGCGANECNLHVTHCSNLGCTTSTDTEFDDSDDAGEATSIAIGTDGRATVSTYNRTNGNLEIYKCANINCTSMSSDTEVSDSDDVGDYGSMAIAPDGLPVISYYDATNGNLQVTKCAIRGCSTTTGTALTSGTDLGTMAAPFRSSYLQTINMGDEDAYLTLDDIGNFHVNGLVINSASTDGQIGITPSGSGDLTINVDNDSNLLIPGTITGTNSQDLISATLTNQTTSGTQRGLVITNTNETQNATTEALISLINNESTASTVTDGLIISGTAGSGTDTIVDAIDVSDDNITNGINLGTNFLVASGDSINDFTGNGALNVSSNALQLRVAASADALSSTTSSGSGLEVLSSGLALLQGCADGEILKWNETTDVWACGADTGGSGSNSFQTIDTPSGTDPVADSATDTLQLLATGTNLTITGADNPETITFDISESTLAGAGLVANGDALDVGAGTCITVNPNDVAVNQNCSFTWTADHTWNLNGTENLDVTSDLAGTVNMLGLVGTPSSSAGTTRGIFIQQANSANTNGLDTGLRLDNADTDLAITDGLYFDNSGGGGYTNFINTASGTFIVDGSGNMTVANITCSSASCISTGEITNGTITGDDFASSIAGDGLVLDTAATPDEIDVGAGSGITVNTNDVAVNQNFSFTWTADHTWNLNGAENLDITHDLAGSVDVISLIATPSASAGTTRGLLIQQANSANTNGLDNGLVVNNADTDLAITNGLYFDNTGGGGYTNFINTASGTFVVDGSGNMTVANITCSSASCISTGEVTNGSLTGDDLASSIAGDGLVLDTAATPDEIDVGAGTCITVNPNDVAVNQNCSFTWTADHTWNLNGTENLDVTSDLAGTVNMLGLVGTPSSSAGTTRGIFIQQANSANTNGLDTGLRLDNADTDLAITDGLYFDNSGGGGYTNFINTASGTFIVDGSGNMTVANITCSSASCISTGEITDATVTGDDIASSIAGAGLVLTAGTPDVLDIVSGNAGIVVNSNDITLDATVSGDGLSSTTSSGSGLEVIAGQGLSLLAGCSDTQILKWVEATDVWNCAADATGGGSPTLDSILAATADGTAQNSGTHPITWNWALAATGNTGLTLGETTAATSGGTILALTTLSTSTASPLTITNGGTGNIVYNLSSTGDFVIQDNGTPFATFDDSGGITLAPNGSSNVNLTLDSDSSLLATGGSITQTPSSPTIKGGVDAINAGTGTDSFNKVFVAGKYAYYAKNNNTGTCSSSTRDGCELQIYDVSNPASPTYVGGADDNSTTAAGKAVFVSGRYAYLATSGDSGTCSSASRVGCEVQIYDITNPSSPTYINGVDGASANNAGVNSIYVSGRYLYAAKLNNSGTCSSSNRDGCELMIFDVSYPTTPKYIGGTESLNTAGSNVGNTGVYVSGKYAVTTTGDGSPTACSSGNHCEALVWDVSTPSSPSLAGSIDSTNAGTGSFTFNDPVISGKYLYITKSNAAGTCSSATRDGCELMIFDFSNPTSPSYVGGADSVNAGTGSSDSFRQVFVTGRYTYIVKSNDSGTCSASTRDGCELMLFDTNDATSPNYKGGADVGVLNGPNDVFVSGKNAYVASASNGSPSACTSSTGANCEGLIYDDTTVESTSLVTGSAYAGTLQVQDNSFFMNDLSIYGGLTVGQNVLINGKFAANDEIKTSNLGISFTDSDTNPTCSAGDYKIYADTSETKLKKCENGTVSDLSLSGRTLSTAFGTYYSAGAFESKNSYFGEEFNTVKNNDCNPTAAAGNAVNAWFNGDMGNSASATACSLTAATSAGSGELSLSTLTAGSGTFGKCQTSETAATTNGIERLSATSAAGTGAKAICAETLTASTTTSNKIYTATNLPVITMKVKPSTIDTTDTTSAIVAAGISTSDSANATTAQNDLPDTGYFFTNCSTYGVSGAASGCSNSTWYGMVSSGGSLVGTAQTCSTGSGAGALTSNFSYLRIEIRATNDIHFYADYDTVTGGINEVECGSGVASTGSTSAMTMWLEAKYISAAVKTTALDIDYFRSWQDDNVPPPDDSVDTTPSGDPIVTEAPIVPEASSTDDDPSEDKNFFSFLGATSEDQVFNHDIYIKGTLFADKIKANQIEGLEIYTDKLDSLAKLLASQTATTVSGATTDTDPTGQQVSTSSGGAGDGTGDNALQMDAMSLNLSDGLSVGGQADFHGNVFFYKLVTFVEKTVFKNDVTLQAHLLTEGDAPDITVSDASGVASTDIVAPKADIQGNDISGQISLTVGDNTTKGDLFSLKFKKQYAKAPNIIVTPVNADAASLGYYVTSTTDGFKLVASEAPKAGSTVIINYWVVQ